MALYQVCSNYTLGAKNGPAPGSHFLHKLIKLFLSETIRPRLLIFGIQLHLVDLYQACSNYIPRAKNGPAQGVTCFTLAYLEKCEKIFLSETTGPKALTFGI